MAHDAVLSAAVLTAVDANAQLAVDALKRRSDASRAAEEVHVHVHAHVHVRVHVRVHVHVYVHVHVHVHAHGLPIGQS